MHLHLIKSLFRPNSLWSRMEAPHSSFYSFLHANIHTCQSGLYFMHSLPSSFSAHLTYEYLSISFSIQVLMTLSSPSNGFTTMYLITVECLGCFFLSLALINSSLKNIYVYTSVVRLLFLRTVLLKHFHQSRANKHP